MATRRECELAPGDVLFIPALWFHNVTSIGFSVALNVFWRSHQPSPSLEGPAALTRAMYDPKDLYGNRDPPAATQAMAHVDAAAAELAALPTEFRQFYARRAIRALETALAALVDGDETGNEAGDVQGSTANSCSGGGGGTVLGGEDAVSGGDGAVSSGDGAVSGGDGAVSEAQCRERPGGPRVVLSTGAAIPLLGVGTWELSPHEARAAVEAALRAGVRHLDCASIYRNEAAVGEAIHAAMCEGRVRRADLFVTSKLWISDARPANVRAACLASLRALQLDRLDLYLLHWPPPSMTDLEPIWRELEALVTDGLVVSIGVANRSLMTPDDP